MKKDIAKKLSDRAEEVAKIYSSKTRSQNFNQETFSVNKIIPLSEAAAVVIYEKNTGKRVLCLFLYIRPLDSWFNMFPTDSHLLAFDRVKQYKEEIERYNYGFNFEEITKTSTPNGSTPGSHDFTSINTGVGS
jgi:hypothetical protein